MHVRSLTAAIALGLLLVSCGDAQAEMTLPVAEPMDLSEETQMGKWPVEVHYRVKTLAQPDFRSDRYETMYSFVGSSWSEWELLDESSEVCSRFTGGVSTTLLGGCDGVIIESHDVGSVTMGAGRHMRPNNGIRPQDLLEAQELLPEMISETSRRLSLDSAELLTATFRGEERCESLGLECESSDYLPYSQSIVIHWPTGIALYESELLGDKEIHTFEVTEFRYGS